MIMAYARFVTTHVKLATNNIHVYHVTLHNMIHLLLEMDLLVFVNKDSK